MNRKRTTKRLKLIVAYLTWEPCEIRRFSVIALEIGLYTLKAICRAKRRKQAKYSIPACNWLMVCRLSPNPLRERTVRIRKVENSNLFVSTKSSTIVDTINPTRFDPLYVIYYQ